MSLICRTAMARSFSGDVDYDDDNDGTIDRYQRGLRNLSAALDVVANTFSAHPARSC